MYKVKEIFYSIQGEGYHSGRSAVFCRFSGCNLWTGREEDRSSAICKFCDTDFLGVSGEGGGRFETPEDLAEKIDKTWGGEDSSEPKFVVCTGGEPMLQLDPELIKELQSRNFYVAVETNGTIAVPLSVDWVCVSPKAGTKLEVTWGDELKVVYPQKGLDPNQFPLKRFGKLFIQPKEDENTEANVEAALKFCLKHTNWRLSLQLHKHLGIR